MLIEKVAVKTIWTESLIEVGLLSRLYDVFKAEHASRVDHIIRHLFISWLLDIRLAVHMVRPPVYLFKVLCYDLFYLLAIFKDFWILSFYLPLDSGHYRMTFLDPEYLVCHLVELLNLAFPQQMAQILNVLCFFK